MRGKKNVEAGTTVAVENSKATEVLPSSEKVTTVAKTKEQSDRKSEPVIEKTRASEKDIAPSIILSWIAPDGSRRTRTYTCAELRINEEKNETFQKTGTKTTINISIEAQVIEKL